MRWCASLFMLNTFRASVLSRRPGLSGALVFVCVALHASACAAVWPRARRAGTLTLHKRLMSLELKDKNLRRALAFLALVWSWLLYLLHTHYLRPDERGFRTGGTTWADLPFHLNIISSFLYGANSDASVFRPLASVFYSNSSLAYPYLPDFHTAFNVAAGSTLREALVIPGALLLGSFLLLLYFLGVRLGGSVTAACAAIPLTLFTGGTGAISLYNAGWNWENFMKKDHVFHLVDGTDAFWFSLPAHILFPQRTTQFAYSLDAAILLLLLIAHTRSSKSKTAPEPGAALKTSPATADHTPEYNDKDVERVVAANAWDAEWVELEPVKPTTKRMSRAVVPASASPAKLLAPPTVLDADEQLVSDSIYDRAGPVSPAQKLVLHLIAGFATGLLPLLQPHSFVSVGSVAATVAVCDVIARAMTAFNACARDGSPRPGFTAADWSSVWCWLAYGVVAFAIGLPQFIPFFGRVSGSHGFIRFITIWSTKGTGPVGLWLKALGLYVPLFLASAFTLTRRNPAQLFFYLGFSAVFLEANFIIFQPWEMDNTKVFYVWVFGASVFVCALMRSLLRVVSRSKLLSGAAVLLLTAVYASLTISGILCSVQETVSNSEMFDLVDVEYARWVRDNTPPHAVFIEPSEHYPRHFRVVRMVTIAFSLLLFVIILFLNTVSPQESALAGRAVLAGYAGWLSSHGLNYGKRMSDMNDMMTGSGNAYRLLYDYNVTHITVPWKLRTSFNIEFLNAVANRVTSNGRFTVFEVARSELLAPVQACNDGDGVAVNVEAKCRERGCMWLPRFAGARCQVSHTLAQGERVIDCAPRMSMTEEKCHDMWCSWYFNYNGPWCQAPSHSVGDRHRAFAPMSILTPDFDCGWHGMDVQQCVDRGCTWTPAGSNPWCTYKGADKKPANIIDTIEPM